MFCPPGLKDVTCCSYLAAYLGPSILAPCRPVSGCHCACVCGGGVAAPTPIPSPGSGLGTMRTSQEEYAACLSQWATPHPFATAPRDRPLVVLQEEMCSAPKAAEASALPLSHSPWSRDWRGTPYVVEELFI